MPHPGLTNTPRGSRQGNISHFHLFDCPLIPRTLRHLMTLAQRGRVIQLRSHTQQEGLAERRVTQSSFRGKALRGGHRSCGNFITFLLLPGLARKFPRPRILGNLQHNFGTSCSVISWSAGGEGRSWKPRWFGHWMTKRGDSKFTQPRTWPPP